MYPKTFSTSTHFFNKNLYVKCSQYFFNLFMSTHPELYFSFIFTFFLFASFSLLLFYLLPQFFHTKKIMGRVTKLQTLTTKRRPRGIKKMKGKKERENGEKKIGLRFWICGCGRLNKKVFLWFIFKFYFILF